MTTVSHVLSLHQDAATALKRGTRALYATQARLYIEPTIGQVSVFALRQSHWREVIAAALGSATGDEAAARWSTARNAVSALRSALRWYWEEEMLEQDSPVRFASGALNVIRRESSVPSRRRRREAYTEEEAALLLQSAEALGHPEVADMIRVAYGTGMRLGEILGLRWTDIDWGNLILTRGFSLTAHGVDTHKSSSEERDRLCMPASVRDLLVRRYEARSRWAEYVFTDEVGAPLAYEWAKRRIRLVRQEAANRGVPLSKTFHSLRHLFASRAFAEGRDAAFVQNQLGHHSAAFTLTQYVHLLDRHGLDEGYDLDRVTPSPRLEPMPPAPGFPPAR